jgi:hypothetical protein
MTELNFNIYAFARPTTVAECSRLLIEALRVAEELGELINANEAFLEEHATPLAA